MSLHPYTNEELNFFKFASIVLNEFPKALRNIFSDMWNNRIAKRPGFQPWDDSNAVRNMLLNNEGPRTKIPTIISYQDWDCTALFQATLYAKTFALPDSKGNFKPLGELYIKNRVLVPGTFHSPVASSSGDPNETIALAIDQLRLLRNTLCHSSSPRVVKVTFDQYVQYAKEAFTAVNLSTSSLDTIGNLAESDFPIPKVDVLKERVVKQRNDYFKFLEKYLKEELDDLKKTAKNTEKSVDEINAKINELLKKHDTPDPSTGPIDVLLLTTDDVEYGEAHKILNSSSMNEDTGGRQGQLCSGEIGRNKVALMKLSPTTIGVSETLALCSETIQKFKPKAIVGLGVSSGMKEDVHDVGDVLISSQIQLLFKNCDGFTRCLGPTFDCNLGLSRLFADCCKFGWRAPRQDVLVPKVHVGQFISGSQDIENETLKETLRTLCPEAIGVDMQSQELFQTFQNSGVAWVHCKSITKWVDGSKNSRWHTFGAAVSASVVEHTLNNFYIPQQIEAFEKFLPKHVLPPMVPHFTGRKDECEKVARYMTSQPTRLVTISGSPGFGKTSLAIVVGHHLKRQGLPVYFLSLKKVKSANDLTSELLNCISSTPSNIENKEPSRSTDELCRILAEIPMEFFIVLDNADNLFESSGQETSQEVLDLLEKMFTRCKNVTFLCTTRMNLEFLKIKFRGHELFNIAPLDNQSSSKLAQKIIPQANERDCSRIAKICGRVPLAIELLCGVLTEISPIYQDITHFLDEFCRSSQSIIDLLDNPDWPSSLRLKTLFESSFKRLSQEEQEAFVSLSVFVDETFKEQTAVKVIGQHEVIARRTLYRLKRKCLIDSTTSEAKLLSFHPLIKTFAAEKGQHDMKEIAATARSRFLSHYIGLFEDLNRQFLGGNSLSAFRNFEMDKENICHSLLEGVSNETVCDAIFAVLSTADMFLDTIVYFDHRSLFDHIYNSAIIKAKQQKNIVATHQLLLGRAFGMIPSQVRGAAPQLLKEAEGIEKENPKLISNNGKRMCYHGIYLLITGVASKGCEILERGISYLSSENTVLKVLSCQILAIYFQFINDSVKADKFHKFAVTECENKKDLRSFLDLKKVVLNDGEKDEATDPGSQPLLMAFTLLLSCLAKKYRMKGILERLGSIVSQIRVKIERKAKCDRLYFPLLCYINRTLAEVNEHEEACHSLQRASDIALVQYGEENNETANILHVTGIEKSNNQDYVSALQSLQQALDIRLKLYGKEHLDTATSYHVIGETQHAMKDYDSALQSKQEALAVRLKLHDKEHIDIEASYHSIALTQHEMKNYELALQSHQQARNLMSTLYQEDHPDTATSYHNSGITQNEMEDHDSALQSHKKALGIRLKTCGEEHPDTASSYYSIGITQYEMGDYDFAVESHRKALDIRLKDSECTEQVAASYHFIGLAQREMGDHDSALKSLQQSLDMRLKLYDKEHQYTADSYYEIGVTQHEMKDYDSALQSKQEAINICSNLFGKEHPNTAASYSSIGVTQHEMEDYDSAFQSHQHALNIRLMICDNEPNQDTAESYYSVGLAQCQMGDHCLALQSHQEALQIRLKLYGEEHTETAESYYSIGVTQHKMEDYVSAMESHQKAVKIRLKLHDEEHPSIANSYQSIGIIQREMKDSISPLQTQQQQQGHSMGDERNFQISEHDVDSDSSDILNCTLF